MALTPEQFEQLKQRLASLQQGGTQAPTQQDSTGGVFGEVKNRVQAAGSQVQQQIAGQGGFSGQSAIRRGVGATATAFSTPLGVAKDLLPQRAEKGLEKVGEGIGKGINFLADKVGDSPQLQEWVSKNPDAANTLEEVLATTSGLGDISGNILMAQGGANLAQRGVNLGKKAIAQIKPATRVAGRVFKSAGESSYRATVQPSEQTSRALSTYKESTPNVFSRAKSALRGEAKKKPITEANTAARQGLIGTEKEIGVQAGRKMKELWKGTVKPALRGSKARMDMKKLWAHLEKKIRSENPELSRQKALVDDLKELQSEYKNVGGVGLDKANAYKEGWTRFQAETAFKGKPISSTAKEVRMMAADATRDFVRKNVPQKARDAFIDYGNLKSIREAGIKSDIGDLAKKSISRGAWQFVMDKAVTPVATTMGKTLYRTGEGLEFIGEAGAKTVGEVLKNKVPVYTPALQGIQESHKQSENDNAPNDY